MSTADRVPAGWYVGLSLGAGNVVQVGQSVTTSDLLHGGAIFVGADTPLGRMIVGFGYAEPDRRRAHLSFGRSFF